ncbi:MAG: hypothetical protein Q9186_006054 [Xanthomendoza sp. 1 TL-2023]
MHVIPFHDVEKALHMSDEALDEQQEYHTHARHPPEDHHRPPNFPHVLPSPMQPFLPLEDWLNRLSHLSSHKGERPRPFILPKDLAELFPRKTTSDLD